MDKNRIKKRFCGTSAITSNPGTEFEVGDETYIGDIKVKVTSIVNLVSAEHPEVIRGYGYEEL